MSEPEPITAARIRDAVRTLRELTECQCDPSYSSRALVDPVCSHEEREDVDALAAAIQQLTRERDEGTAQVVRLSNELAAAERELTDVRAALLEAHNGDIPDGVTLAEAVRTLDRLRDGDRARRAECHARHLAAERELTAFRAECDRVGIPYDPAGLVRHHRGNAGVAAGAEALVGVLRAERERDALRHAVLCELPAPDDPNVDGELADFVRRVREAATEEPPPTVLEFNYHHPRRKIIEPRRVRPGRLYYGTTEHHPGRQWLYEAYCLDRRAVRTFPLELMGPRDG